MEKAITDSETLDEAIKYTEEQTFLISGLQSLRDYLKEDLE